MKKFINPDLEVIYFEEDEIILTSGEPDELELPEIIINPHK